jgi:hypothetical protein
LEVFGEEPETAMTKYNMLHQAPENQAKETSILSTAFGGASPARQAASSKSTGGIGAGGSWADPPVKHPRREPAPLGRRGFVGGKKVLKKTKTAGNPIGSVRLVLNSSQCAV